MLTQTRKIKSLQTCNFASTNLKFCTKPRGVIPLLCTKFQICRGKITGFRWSGDKNTRVLSNSAARMCLMLLSHFEIFHNHFLYKRNILWPCCIKVLLNGGHSELGQEKMSCLSLKPASNFIWQIKKRIFFFGGS